MLIRFDRGDESRVSRTVKPTGDPEKAAKYGPDAEYTFHYAEVSLATPSKHLLSRIFKHKDITFMWRSLPSLKSDGQIRMHTYDVLEYLSSTYDQTLALLPDSFSVLIDPSPLGVEDRYDAFICHAHEDKQFVRPLAHALRQAGLILWYDEFVLQVGDSLLESIDRGLVRSRAGVVILSPHFFGKRWPKRELDGIVALASRGRSKLLPVWHNIDADEVAAESPTLAGLVAAK